MKKYRVTVNGTTYEVDVEQVGSEAASVSPVSSAPAAPPVQAPASAPAASGNGEKVVAPMPGTILKVNVMPGSAVKAGDSLLVLEAMKMENDIAAPCDGTIASVSVSQGASVSTGDVLVTYN